MEERLQSWKRFVDGLPENELLRPIILASWQRSRDAGVDSQRADLHDVGEADLNRRLTANKELLEIAGPHLNWASSFLSQIPHVIYITDRDGIILKSVSNHNELGSLGLLPGFDWSEERMGTNGAGTSIRADQPVAVIGPEHFLTDFHNCTCTAAPLHDAEGRVVGAIDISTSVEDGSPERTALAAHIAYTIDRQIALRHLQFSERRRNEFFSMLVHELRSPLAPIRSATDALAMSDSDPELVGLIQKQVQQLARLISDLSEATRLDHGKLQLQTENVNLVEVVVQSTETVRPLLSEKRQHLRLALPKSELIVEGDPIRLVEIVTNLLTNACKYTQEDGRIELHLQQSDDNAQLQVRDNGVGIRADLLPHIFDMFSQSERARTESRGGLGIGLAIVKRLVDLHGGSISVQSEGPHQGSIFKVTLPSVKDATAKPPQDLPAAAVEKRCRILVVDDVRASARAAQVLLSRMGHDVDVATNGEDALDAAVKFRPDVIFLDISLPDFDGYEVARRLRKKSGLKHVTLAALTGHSPADVNESDRARFDHFLVKPIDIKALKAVLVSVAKSQDPIDSDSAEDNQ